MENQRYSAIDSLLGKLSNEGWAHNNEASHNFLRVLLPTAQSSLIDFSARKLPKKTKFVLFSFENHYYEAHRLLKIATKRPQIWINVDRQLSYWTQIEETAQAKFIIREIGDSELLLVPKTSTHWLSTFKLSSE